MALTSKELVEIISKIIYEKKGLNVLALYVGDFSTVTDYLIIAEGAVDRHVTAIGQEIVKELRNKESLRPYHAEGLGVGDWILIDYFDVVVHIFKPETRSKYNLEELYAAGRTVELELPVSA